MWRYYVYVHKKADTGEVFYVGKGTKRKRDSAAIYDRAFDRTSRNQWWIHTVAKHGCRVEIIASFLSDADSQQFERALIKAHGRENLVNLTAGGDGHAGLSPSPETREKLSVLAKRPRTAAWVKSIRRARKGGGNGGVVKTGDTLPDEWKNNIRRTKIGELNPMFGKVSPRAKPVIDAETGCVYSSVQAAADSIGMKMQTLWRKLKGKNPNNTTLRFA